LKRKRKYHVIEKSIETARQTMTEKEIEKLCKTETKQIQLYSSIRYDTIYKKKEKNKQQK